MKYPVHVFEAVARPQGYRIGEYTLDGLGELLEDTFDEVLPSKSESQLFNCCEFEDGYRTNATCLFSTALIMDIDETTRIEEVSSMLREYGALAWIYNSPSHKVEAHRFRVVMPYAAPIMNDPSLPFGAISEHKKVWLCVDHSLGNCIDKQTKDISRCFYIPGQYGSAEAHHFKFIDGTVHKPSDWVDAVWDDIRKDHEPQEPTMLDNMRENERKKRRKVMNADWAGLADCPYVKQEYIDRYLSLAKGNHHNGLFVFMCRVFGNAKIRGHEITSDEVTSLARELDFLDGGWYASGNRKIELEAQRALRYCQ